MYRSNIFSTMIVLLPIHKYRCWTCLFNEQELCFLKCVLWYWDVKGWALGVDRIYRYYLDLCVPEHFSLWIQIKSPVKF